MQYLGGKSRHSESIKDLILKLRGSRLRYVEPFIGGGSVFEKVSKEFKHSYAGDACEDLILLWKELQRGWVPPSVITKEQYQAIRHQPPSALHAFVGFGCSFGAKWFGGYAANKDGRNYAQKAHNLLLSKIKNIKGTFRYCSYEGWDKFVDQDTLVYCDPPYAGTEPYGAVEKFDHAGFWDTMRGWVGRGALVLVSEYAAPNGWGVVWEKEHRQVLCGSSNRPKTTEKIFMYLTPSAVNSSIVGVV